MLAERAEALQRAAEATEIRLLAVLAQLEEDGHAIKVARAATELTAERNVQLRQEEITAFVKRAESAQAADEL